MLLSILTVVSCGHITVKNTEVCGILGADGAHCANTLTPDTRDLTKEEWDAISAYRYVAMPIEAYAEWKKIQEYLCHESNLCDYETVKQLRAFDDKYEDMRRYMEAAQKRH